MTVVDFISSEISLDINGKPITKPIIKTNPDYHNIEVCIEKQLIDEDIILQTAISLEQEIMDLKIELARLKNLTDYNKGQRIKNKKKCNIM